MSECFEFSSSMTGSTNTGPLQPQKDSPALPAQLAPFDLCSTPGTPTRRGHRHRHSRKMTLTSPNGQPIQLTPLWEHVVRTRKFPSEVDTRLTFLEISERLRDPEWEVRQHAVRVLIDVLPTLSPDVVDKVMQPVVPELVNNLGHPAPAVRKGALDAFRVFLVHSHDRENTIKRILQDGLSRSEVRDSFQTNVTTGVILSVPSLLFPSSSGPVASSQLIKEATIALASRLAQVPHQEAVLKSLIKIRDAVGVDAFEGYLEDYDNKLKRNIEILSKIYNVRSGGKARRRIADGKGVERTEKDVDRKWEESDSDTSGIVEEEDEVNGGAMPAARVVLETEIKFNEETAITMTILEEKEDSEKEQDDESGTDVRNDAENKDSSPDRRKTPRRVHFGGEIVKLRTPDSDETESVEATPKTRIPVPVSPATKMPKTRRRPSSQPCSPQRDAGKTGRPARSVSSSPKREVYTHNAQLSPKKSILTRTSSPVVVRPVESKKKKDAANAESVEDEKSPAKGADNESQSERKENSVQGSQSSGTPAGSNWVSPDEKQREPSALDGSKNSSRTRDSEDSTRHKKDAKEEKNYWERKHQDKVENDQKRIIEDKAAFVENVPKVDHLFGSPVEDDGVECDRDDAKDSGVDRKETPDDAKLKKNVEHGERSTKSDKAAPSNVVHGVDGMEVILEEPSWEDLGLVDREVLEDLHNKDDWRARVRGLERVASALRTSSALIAIEPRLGSLLHTVLGCERSCRVAAAGLAVAKVVVAGVSEEALKKRLPQLAWGLARQGGPCAAQLARIAMLRLRPALLLEELLQPQCLNARNARTRENTLQLLIFSLVTFPSTEFKVDAVANKVARMVRDRRRRVRQAALDTLAVLAQIYESEEVLAAGKRASEAHHDGEAMMSAIRARLARKSLPLVSADGLVMYGLQISPTVQIATGPDVDWIVAGSGSVSPAIGRTKGQIIATRSEKEKLARGEDAKGSENPWIDRPNLVALGVGMRPKTDHPVVWQIVPSQDQNLQCEDELNLQPSRGVNTEFGNDEGGGYNLNSRNRSRVSTSSRESKNYRNVEESLDQREINNKADSRIPVLFARDRGAKTGSVQEKPANAELSSVNLKKRLKDASESSVNSHEPNARSCGTMFRRKRSQRESSTNTSYDTFCSIKNLNNVNTDSSNLSDTSSQEYLDVTRRIYRKYLEKDKTNRKSDNGSRFIQSNSSDSQQSTTLRNIQQQTFVMHDMYNTISRRQGRFGDENSFRPLQTAPTPLSHSYNRLDFNPNGEEISDRNISPQARFYRRTKDATAQKLNNVELISSDAQTSDYFPAIRTNSYRRRLRSLSPSQLYRRQQFSRMAPNEVHAVSMYNIDKAVVSEEEYNEKNKHFLPQESYRPQTIDTIETEFEVEDRDLSSSDALENNEQDNGQDMVDAREDSESRSSSPERPNVDSAFDIIAIPSILPSRDEVDFIIALDKKVETELETTIVSVDDDASKSWSSEEDVKLRHESRSCSRNSERFEYPAENPNISEGSVSDEAEAGTEERTSAGRRSAVSVLSAERLLTSESLQYPNDAPQSEDIQETQATTPSRSSGSPKKLSRSPSRNSIELEALKSPGRSSRASSRKLSIDSDKKEPAELRPETPVSSLANCEDEPPVTAERSESRADSKSVGSPAIIIASRPHSSEASTFIDNRVEDPVELNENDGRESAHRFVDESNGSNESNESNESNTVEEGQSRDSSSETNTEPGILKIETEPLEPVSRPRRTVASKVPRPTKRYRSTGRGNSEKLKPVVQTCFTDLESKEWETVMKGLKTLSHVTKNQPEYLDAHATPTINRLLGQQIKSLRSQVARTACTAAGDVFSSRIRGIDQDFDDIAAPLLHRTADTNRFLRADCNAALDRMIEHLPPHKTIGVIVQRGAGHQNAIVRAATARLLTSIVERMGPEQTMTLPKDVRDKLLITGARLLIDGNLDARNHAKRMFRRLMRCEGFNKTLTEAVPEVTLRHIDKTLKTL
ncbi:uncharacterized protein LOC116433699 isoform X1 [Nomia melanderi]|uniref:uncharacterized protein LOC116433699 isoform X1 n=1 Tax=Nomia melanderi TaxID=2448451 RepID=UPI0013043164|nr:uncharacterized protein LOC116433699 isoform X3 [Nomia melanderi]